MQTMHYFKKLFSRKKTRVLTLLALFLALLFLYAATRDRGRFISSKELLKLQQNNKIQSITLDSNILYIKTEDAKTYKIYPQAKIIDELLKDHPLHIEHKSNYGEILMLVATLAMLFLIFSINRRVYGKNSSFAPTLTGKSESTETIMAQKTDVRFEDVAGISEVKEELEEIIDFLKNPHIYKKHNIRLPKGALLAGPPGVGKTLIAKAVATEANVPFFYHSGADFVQIYVGAGAKRVKELFDTAKRSSPSIIFIDEIDAIGRRRDGLQNEEREATLNQLLSEMDGFQSDSGVIVIAATNKIEMLDDALLRPGRFDRRIHISLPDINEREKILELYLKDKKHTLKVKELAKETIGFSAATLETLINEAAIHAMRNKKGTISKKEIDAVKDKVIYGKQKIHLLSNQEREIEACYQAAKAVVATWLGVEFEKISISNTHFISQEKQIVSSTEILNKIKVYMSGAVTTKYLYADIFTNASIDLKEAQRLIEQSIHDHIISIEHGSTITQIFEKMQNETASIVKNTKHIIQKVQEQLLKEEVLSCSEIKRAVEEYL